MAADGNARSVRCAVYTRVSSDERLDQSFNSLDAQREAGTAFIASQRAERWHLIPEVYADGGYSGGTLERPALKRLLAAIRAGRVDVIVLYKIDRLTRSLMDFAKLVEVFDRHGVAFVSVTQQFNTTTAMGRLMLNVLLSFAQFEREVAGERIRDKIAASKKRGLWMGGHPPLGYDARERRLVLNPAEAELVRRIFARFAELRSTTALAHELSAAGAMTKAFTTAKGEARTGKPIFKQYLDHLLRNRIYLGEITHKGAVYAGQHDAIVTRPAWDAAQVVFAENARQRRGATRARHPSDALLRGLLFTADGVHYVPTRTRKPHGKVYRYYLPYSDKRDGAGHSAIGPVPAGEVETLVTTALCAALAEPDAHAALWRRLAKTAPRSAEAGARAALKRLAAAWPHLFPDHQDRLLRQLIERIVLRQDGAEIVWRGAGWAPLIDELAPTGDASAARARSVLDEVFA